MIFHAENHSTVAPAMTRFSPTAPLGATTMKGKNVILTCAITGSGTSPSILPCPPVTPDQIVEGSGATVLHLHACGPNDGRPIKGLAVWRQFVPRSRETCVAVIDISQPLVPTADIHPTGPRHCSRVFKGSAPFARIPTDSSRANRNHNEDP
jgi:hypothetical protein